MCACAPRRRTDTAACSIAEGDHVDNDASVQELAAAARAYAEAGADCVAPSDMMDGRVAAIRAALDDNGLERTVLMSYSVKFQSNLYGPFRVAADSAPKAQSALRDRASYQLDPARPADAWLCAERDVAEGADILMVKPGLPYLDLLRELSREFPQPWAVYHVSGEFAALEALAAQGLAPRAALHREILTAFKRAGASMIITYGARSAREWLAACDAAPRSCLRARCASRPAACIRRCARSAASAARRVFMTGGHGARLRDVDGREYLDFCMAFGPLILGHGNAAVRAAAERRWRAAGASAPPSPTAWSSPNSSPAAFPGSRACASSTRAPRR